MKKRIIRINDISQIDTSKASVYDLNNRYIDPLGNIFGLRYNKDTRRVDIIKLERFHPAESRALQQIATRHKGGGYAQEMKIESVSENEPVADDNVDESMIEPEVFIEDVIENAVTHKERINAIVKNIYDSDVFPKENKMESGEFDDIVRNLEIEGTQQLEKLETYYRELTNYPRSMTYYQAKLDNAGKSVFDKLSGNKERLMRFIFLYEMTTTIRRIYTNLKKHIHRLDEFTENKNIEEKAGVMKHQKQSFIDARTSIKNTIYDTDEILARNELLHSYACNAANYK